MTKLTDYTTYADAQAYFSSDKLWELFDGNRERLNIAHECIDRHARRAAVRGDRRARRRPRRGAHFREIARDSSRFANYLAAQGVRPAIASR